MLPIKFYGRSI